MKKNRFLIDGVAWVRITRAAELIGTNSQGISKMMGDGSLSWRQLKENSKTILVDEEGVLRLRAERRQWIAEREEPKKAATQSADLEKGTMNPLRARLRNQLSMHLIAADGGQPGKRRV